MKHGAVTRIVAVTVVAVAAAAAVWYLDHLPPSRLASLLGISVTVSDLESESQASPTVAPLPAHDPVPTLAVSTVAIQTFSGSTLIRTATGTVVSSDGLILTTTAAVPYGSGSFTYSVATTKGAFVRAHRVAFDGAAGLVLLKVDGEDMDAVAFGGAPTVQAGEELTLVAATVVVSGYAPVILPAMVAYVVGKSDPVLSFDRTLLPVLVGARVVDRSGKTVGLLRQGGTIGVIGASSLETFVRRHLSAQ